MKLFECFICKACGHYQYCTTKDKLKRIFLGGECRAFKLNKTSKRLKGTA